MSKNAKLVRGQVRQIVKEELPAVLDQELAKAINAKLQMYIQAQLQNIQKEVTSFLIRNATATPATVVKNSPVEAAGDE